MNAVWLVARTYLAPIGSARALRLGLLIGVLLVAAAAALRSMGYLDRDQLSDMREWALVPLLPLAAALLAEMPLREGIRSRTLLYPMLGPVSRRAIALVRTTVTGLIVALVVTLLIVALHALGGGWAALPRELGAALLGGLAYSALFGCLHLVNTRGLVTAMGLFLFLDDPLGRLPFGIRNLSPAHHLRVLTGADASFDIPIDVNLPDPSPFGSAVVLLLVAAVATAGVAALFQRKSLGELG